MVGWWCGVGSYPLLCQAPTPVEVELGCDNTKNSGLPKLLCWTHALRSDQLTPKYLVNVFIVSKLIKMQFVIVFKINQFEDSYWTKKLTLKSLFCWFVIFCDILLTFIKALSFKVQETGRFTCHNLQVCLDKGKG